MITSKLSGGLGNQMFQYAAGRALSKRIDVELTLDLEWFKRRTQKNIRSPRSYALAAFQLSPSVRFLQNSSSATRLLSTSKKRNRTVFSESTHTYDPRFEALTGNTVLDGYWQSERYFKDQADTIRTDFAFRTANSATDSCLERTIRSTNSVSVHIRRGDYVTDPYASDFHGNLSANYYSGAIRAITDLVASPHLFVFSDEIDWCRKHFSSNLPMTFVTNNHQDGAITDLRLMSTCCHHIVANSSFSWWGAWLGQNSEKTVVAPKSWFSTSTHDTSDVVPASWHTI